MATIGKSAVRLLMPVALLLTGSAHAGGVPRTATAADAAWQTLYSSGPRPQRKPGESSLAYFMRGVELSDRRRRELGLEFWSNYPQDARRYTWLLLTVHLPPHYPKNLGDWADNETRLGANAAAVNREQVVLWDRQYAVMRRAFWSSQGVTDQERRFLRYGELKQGLLRLREAAARGEDIVAQPLLEGIVAYAREYREALSESDASEFLACHQQLIAGVFENAADLKLDVRALNTFAQALQASGNRNVEADLKRWIADLGRWSHDAGARVSSAAAPWRRLPNYPNDQPTTWAGDLIFWHSQNVMTRKYRDIGLRLWDEYPERSARLEWLGKTLWETPDYLLDFVDGITRLAAHQPETVAIDEPARAEWERLNPQLRATVWNDPETTTEDRAGLRFFELWSQLVAVRQAGNGRAQGPDSQSLLDGIHELYAQYGHAGGAFTLATFVFQNASWLGFSDRQLEQFIKPMLQADDPKLRRFAQGKQRFLQLRHLGVELKGNTRDGQSFDVRDLRGKIVLLDYWATTCSSCISAMPRIKDVYDRYRSQGFEVVSVCWDGQENARKLERLERQMGLTWTTLAADDLREEVEQRYGYSSVPEYMLLDRDGRLVAATSEIDMGRNLESLVKQLLANDRSTARP